MPSIRKLKFCVVALHLALLPFAVTSSALADEIDWQKYLQSGAVAAAIASAVAQVDQCTNPLDISESKNGNTWRLVFTCLGSEEEQASAIVEFVELSKGVLVPSRFELAG